jgi:lipopolysaccharide transport system ATP-binding protein
MGSIDVSNLGKAYKQYPSRWARVAEWLMPGAPPRHQLHWVLRDINFVVNPGEAVGIIGMNGAGKSTLLKMITGTTQPTTGSVHIGGRLAALLELGMGFHPEFTGRQNAFMAGQLMGFTPEEIASFMPEIEAFAEIGDYIDQPVRVYSSGMQVRLAFSVATAKRPDILIVDEALSVGDKYFASKSINRIREFIAKKTTLLLVSHDASAIKTICNKALLLNKGQMVDFGEPETIVEKYNSVVFHTANHNSGARNISEKPQEESPIWQKIDNSVDQRKKNGLRSAYAQIDTGEVELHSFKITNEQGDHASIVTTGRTIIVAYRVVAKVDLDDLFFGISIRDRLAVSVFSTNSFALRQSSFQMGCGEMAEIKFSMKLPLQIGCYALCMGVASGGRDNGEFDRYLLNYHNFEVIEIIPAGQRSEFGGVVNLRPSFSVKSI